MFSVEEKRRIAQAVEDVIREINHPEMDNDHIAFSLHVSGRESWSWADIHENSREVRETPNPWNEMARNMLRGGRKEGE